MDRDSYPLMSVGILFLSFSQFIAHILVKALISTLVQAPVKTLIKTLVEALVEALLLVILETCLSKYFIRQIVKPQLFSVV